MVAATTIKAEAKRVQTEHRLSVKGLPSATRKRKKTPLIHGRAMRKLRIRG